MVSTLSQRSSIVMLFSISAGVPGFGEIIPCSCIETFWWMRGYRREERCRVRMSKKEIELRNQNVPKRFMEPLECSLECIYFKVFLFS